MARSDYTIEISLDNATRDFRESLLELRKDKTLLGMALFLAPDVIAYRDNLPRSYKTAPSAAEYIRMPVFLSSNPAANEAKQAALGTIAIFEQLESKQASCSFLTLSHLVVNRADASDVRFILEEPFSLYAHEAYNGGIQNEPELALAFSSFESFEKALKAKLVEKILLATTVLWEGYDFPNRSLMSERLVDSLAAGCESNDDLRKAVSEGFGEGSEKPVAQTKGFTANWRQKPAVLKRKARQASAYSANAVMLVMLLSDKCDSKMRMTAQSYMKSIVDACKKPDGSMAVGVVSPIAGESCQTSFTGFKQSPDGLHFSLASGTYAPECVHVLIRAYAEALNFWQSSNSASLAAFIIDPSGIAKSGGRNFSLMMGKIGRLTQDFPDFQAFYIGDGSNNEHMPALSATEASLLFV
ncbi:MAG: hypothetical protein FWG30_03885 [Eubacteriaceae bacterium]|nr:hypothetical protein [Eubacteriaceae bacterium]